MTLKAQKDKFQKDNPPFNFNAWKKLAESDPQAFEKMRKAVIKAEIAKAPKAMQNRLNGLQWTIDMERKQNSNPTQSMIRIYKKMWNSVYGEEGLLTTLHINAAAQKAGSGRQNLATAMILPFKDFSGD